MRISGLLLLVVLVSAGCNLSREEVASLPTATASGITSTPSIATRTPIPLNNAYRPTQLPLVTTLQPPPLPVSIAATPMGTVNLNTSTTTPDQAVKNYYALVSQGRYDLGWSMLTDTFKQKFNCCAPNYNYADYMKWWDSVDTVEFRSAKTISQTGDHALVYVEFLYVMNDGRRSALIGDPYIALVYDSSLNTWRFDDKRATP